jgi:hypothetical protein
MRVAACTPDVYREEEAAVIAPAPGMNPHGFHTLSACGLRCLIDGKRMVFSPRRLLAKVARRVARRRVG